MKTISYIDVVRNVHIDWVTADLEQEATRKGLAHLRVVHVSSVARAARRRFSESTATLRSETLGLIPSRAESLSAQSGRCQYSRRLRNCPIRHLESQRVATPSPSPTDTDSESIMVVRMACQTGSGCSADSYFTTYQQAASHYANRECSVQPVSLGHSHCHPGATQQAY